MSMKRKFDFTGVETFTRAPEGTYPAKVSKVEEVTFQGGNEGFKISFEATTGLAKGARVIENFPLVQTAMWKLKMFLESCGVKANGRVAVDMEKLIGKVVELTVYHEEYEGQTRARIQSISKFVPKKSEPEEDDIEDDEDDIEDEEDDEEDDIEDSEDDDEEEDDDEDEDEEPVKKSAKKAKTAPKAKEKKQANKSTSKSKKTASKAKSEPEDDDDDWDDDDWDDEE